MCKKNVWNKTIISSEKLTINEKIIQSENHDFESYNIIKDILDYSVYLFWELIYK